MFISRVHALSTTINPEIRCEGYTKPRTLGET